MSNFCVIHFTYLRHMKPSTRRRPRSSGRRAGRCVPSAWSCATDARTPCCRSDASRPIAVAAVAGAADVSAAACPTTWWSLRGRLLRILGFSCRAARSPSLTGTWQWRLEDWHCLQGKRRRTIKYIIDLFVHLWLGITKYMRKQKKQYFILFRCVSCCQPSFDSQSSVTSAPRNDVARNSAHHIYISDFLRHGANAHTHRRTHIWTSWLVSSSSFSNLTWF